MTRPDSFEADPAAFVLDPADETAIELQLGRPLRGQVRVAVRCPCGLPAVVETHPLADDVPFPTLYWLTCRRAGTEIGRLEGSGFMRTVNDRLASDASFRRAFDDAQSDYRQRRDRLAVLEGAGGVGGGPLDRVKCLHAHYAHHLACGNNPVGAMIEQQAGRLLHQPPCVRLT